MHSCLLTELEKAWVELLAGVSAVKLWGRRSQVLSTPGPARDQSHLSPSPMKSESLKLRGISKPKPSTPSPAKP